MITTPSKSDSNKFSNTSKNNNLEISDNKVNDDFSVPSISIYNKKIDEENNNSINNSKNLSKIHTSIIADDLEQLEKLLKLGGNPDVLNKSGETPLYLSVDIENYDAMIILLEFGADCNIQKNDGNTALHLATEKKSELYISALLSHGANPNIINKTNLQTPLHIGIINKINEYILSKFKENNGDIYNIKDKYNKTPFDYAKNDEKYKNLLISIFSEQNKNNDDEKNKCINENSVENYHNFISLSRKIHIADEENNKMQNNDNKESEKSNNNIRDINNCLKKHLMFSSNSKETSSEEKKKKLKNSGASNNSSAIELNDKSSQGDTNKNIINIISDKSSNFSNNTNSKKNICNYNNNINKIYNENNGNNMNLTDRNNDIEKKEFITSIKNGNNSKKYNSNYNTILSSPGINYSVSRSSNIENKVSSIKSNNSNINNNINGNDFNGHFHFNTNTNNTNTNGNNSLSSYNKKKEEGISELNPLDMINQMASSNNSNIFSELQINTNTYNKDMDGEVENSDIKNKKTEEEFFNDDNNKLTLNDELNNMKDNILGNFSMNNNYNEQFDDNINDNNENGENEENKENLNFINSLDDSLEYSKTKSYIINDTPVVMGKNKDSNNNTSDNRYYSEKSKINNKDESVNIYNSNSNKLNTENNIIRNINNKNIERYKNTTSNKSKQYYDNDSEQNFSYDKYSNVSNISSVLQNNNKQSIQQHRQLSYHNNKQSSNNKNKANNNSNNNINNTINTNINVSNYNNATNKENLDPNNNNENKEGISNEKIMYNNKTYNDIKNKDEELNIINTNNNNYYHNSLKNKDININSFPLNTMVIQKKIYKNKITIPDVIKEQKTKDLPLEQFKTNDEKIIFLNDNSNSNINYNEGNSNTFILDNTTQNQYNTFYSDNNSYKINDKEKETNNYSSIFRKALKKKYLIKEFSQTQNSKFNVDTDKYSETLHPQRIPNELITKLRDWLISCDLLCYYNLLIKNNIYDIESYIVNLKNNKINISYKDIEDLGIKKPGHIFRFLLKLQMDIGILDHKVCNYIMSKFNENILTTLGVNVSINDIKYCGILLCPGTNDFSKNCNYTDIFSFLRSKNLMEFKENFVHNGFDQIEFILIQLFSSFAFNKDILNDYMHIYSEQDKSKVIKRLYEEKKSIAKEIGIDYDEREVFYILNEQNEELENLNKKNDENSICTIF